MCAIRYGETLSFRTHWGRRWRFVDLRYGDGASCGRRRHEERVSAFSSVLEVSLIKRRNTDGPRRPRRFFFSRGENEPTPRRRAFIEGAARELFDRAPALVFGTFRVRRFGARVVGRSCARLSAADGPDVVRFGVRRDASKAACERSGSDPEFLRRDAIVYVTQSGT